MRCQYSVIKCFMLCVVLSMTRNVVGQERDNIRVGFWNMENFFDPFVDSTLTYNEYTEEGTQHWTKSRFYKKRNNIYKALLSMSDNKAMGVVGVCEIENEYVLNALFSWTPLKRFNYRWVHYDSPDRRGIDAAIVYSTDIFQLVYSEAIPYSNPRYPDYRSRDIVYAKFFDRVDDTLHVFVNHWPSRYAGELETIEARCCAALLLRDRVDSLMRVCYSPKIIIMGDFNDAPSDESVYNVLKARPLGDDSSPEMLINLFADNDALGFDGTLKHQYHWQIFDQIIVSESMILDVDRLHYRQGSARIFNASFLFEPDDTYKGQRLYRTYIGPKYIGGFSDHLPVYIDLHR